MKELTFEQAHSIYRGKDPITAIQEAYCLGQQEAGVDEQRFQAAKDAMNGMLSSSGRGFDASDSGIANIAQCAVKQADALIAELNRTAEKGGIPCE